jgi:hypothetical protein
VTDEPSDDNLFKPMEAIGDTKVAPAHGIAALALNFALKYHDINTVQDGQLYQQYKLEGKNMTPLHLDMVFETAIRMEAHLLGASSRIADIVVEALEAGVAEHEAEPKPEPKGET